MSVIRELVEIYFNKKVVRAAAQLAYYLTLTIFPLLICVSAILGELNLSETEMLRELATIIPGGAYIAMKDFLAYVSSNSSTTMVIMALTVLVTSSSAAFRAILTIMSEIQDEHRFMGFWKAILSVLLSFLFLAAIYVSCIVIVAGNWLIEFATVHTGRVIFYNIWGWMRFVLLFLLLFVIVFGIYRISAPREKPRRQRLIGALAAAMVLVAASMFFSWTISLSSRYPVVYGSLASIIILMIWLFICGNILIMGNALNIALNRHMERRRYIKRRGDSGEMSGEA